MERSVQAEFHYEYRAEMEALMRRRFGRWAVSWLVLLLIVFPAIDGLRWMADAPGAGGLMLTHLAQTLVVAVGWRWSRKTEPHEDELLRLAFWTLVLNGLIYVALAYATLPEGRSVGFGAIAASHLLACLFLPWTPLQALRPVLPLWLVWLCGRAIFEPDRLGLGDFVGAAFVLSLVVPGLLVCWFRITSLGQAFESRALRRHYADFSRDLFDARKVHEALFPKPRLDGPIRFDYRDAPRLGIGGDYLSAHFDEQDRLNLTLLDVAGDGIAAALTVNRIQGEIERLYGERSSLAPDEILWALNRYVQLTLAPWGIYASAMCFRIDDDGRVEWAGAGHAPAFVRRRDGRVERLLSTTWTLGADVEVDVELRTSSTRLDPGDALLAHSDGACDRPGLGGMPLGYRGIERVVQGAAPPHALAWPEWFMRQLEEFRASALAADVDGSMGWSERDVLIVAVEVGEPVLTLNTLRAPAAEMPARRLTRPWKRPAQAAT